VQAFGVQAFGNFYSSLESGFAQLQRQISLYPKFSLCWMHAFFSFHSALFEGRLICQISNHMVFSLPLSMLYILLILLIVVNLPYFQEEMMSKENPIKL